MPVIKSAKKKLRKDIKREKRNDSVRILMSESLKKFKRNPSEKLLPATVSIVDKAAKNHIIHKNKAARIKSKITKLVAGKTKVSAPSKSPAKTTKKASK